MGSSYILQLIMSECYDIVNRSLYLCGVSGCCMVTQYICIHFPVLFVVTLCLQADLKGKECCKLFQILFKLKSSCFIMPLIIKGWKHVAESISAQVLKHERALSLLYKRLLCDPLYKVFAGLYPQSHAEWDIHQTTFPFSFLQNLSLLNLLPIISNVQPLKVWKRDRVLTWTWRASH